MPDLADRCRHAPIAYGAFSALLLAFPVSADAHSLFGNHDPNRPLVDYLTLGFGHMAGGWDHLLFVVGVVMLAGNVKRAAKVISLFVAGHSLTLLAATIAGWRLDATLVDVVIALSLVYVGVRGLRGRPESLRVFGAVVFAFGLVHGLGLSTRLQDLGLPEDGVVARVLLFNLGVEVGQLTALAVLAGLGTLALRAVRDRQRIARFGFGALTVAGLVAAAILSFPDEATRSQGEPVAANGKATACTRQDTQPPALIGGGHPAKKFYGPREAAPGEDLAHVIGDGLVIVRYRPDLPAAAVKELRAFVQEPASEYVIGAPDRDQEEPVRAYAAYRTLTCTELDVTALQTFRDSWLAYLRDQRAGG